MSHSYPFTYWDTRTTNSYNPLPTCGKCQAVIPLNAKYFVRTTEVSWFRGEDEVETFCEADGKAEGAHR